MTKFTQTQWRKYGFLLLSLLFLAGSTMLHAQTHILTVSAPAGIAGDYNIQIAAFGPQPCDFDTIQGMVVLGTSNGNSLACSAIAADLTGKIVIVDRGECDFTAKALNAQARGARAIIIVNHNIPPNGDGNIFFPGGTSTQVTIPAFGMSLANGNTIKAQLANGVTATIRRNLPTPPSTSNEPVIWGNQPGQGDFNGGLNGWTSNTTFCNNGNAPDTFKLWQWVSQSVVNSICLGGGTDFSVFSPTFCNGAAAFLSEFGDNGGVNCNTALGTGRCPSPHAGDLTSPVINISNNPTGSDLSLRFYQSAVLFDGAFLVAWTTDNGATWDTTQVNEDLQPQTLLPEPSVVRVPLEGTNGANQLQVKFIFAGEYYFWMVDDVAIVGTASNNLQVNDNFYAVAQNYATPLAHVEPIYFLSDIENVGTKAQTNVNLNASVFYRPSATTSFTRVFTSDKSYGTVPAGALVENLPFEGGFTPTAVGQYVGVYEISADSTDAEEENNSQLFNFLVTENLFAKESEPNNGNRPDASEWDANEPRSWAWGNYYFVPESAGYYVQSVSFGVFADSTVADRELLISLYEWTDENENGSAEPEERFPLSYATYLMDGTENGSLINVPFPSEGEAPVQLKDNTAYLLMVEYYSTDQATIFMSSSDEIDYSAMVYVNDTLERPRYAAFLGINDNLSVETYTSRGFGYDLVPAVRMTVGATPSSAQDLKKLNNEFSVFPNPASEAINLQLNLSKQAQNATVRMFDISGKLLQQWNYDNVQKERYQYFVNNLSSGTYFLQVITAEGAGIKKFIVK